MVFRLILPDWIKQDPAWNKHELPPVLEGEFTEEQILDSNRLGYNVYFMPNYPSQYNRDKNVDGADVDTFTCVFVDLDCKDYLSEVADRRHEYATKEDFMRVLLEFSLPPSRIVDSGNGVHGYWYINDLTDMDFLRLQRRLCRHFKTDPAVSKLYQLMRVPGTVNWKNPDDLKLAETITDPGTEYTAEQLSKALPRITEKDEAYCKAHYDKTHGLVEKLEINEELPAKWYKLAKKGTEAYDKFYGQVKDRSQADYRIGHLMYAANFTKEEAMAVLMNTSKASERAGVHRYNYAEGVVSKIWTHIEAEIKKEPVKAGRTRSVRELLDQNPDTDSQKGERFHCDPIFDGTAHGFRLSQVLGLIAGSGVGKTAFGFNILKGFCAANPGFIHLAVTLEQPELEYIQRWRKLSGGNDALIDMVHVLGNYNDDGTYRHLGLTDIEDEVKELARVTGKKVGAVMIDHIGILKKENRNGECQGLIDICQYMKAFAVNTNTFLIMQSQAPREKASIGDIELDKDAAYGTVFFEAFCDYVVTLWQPLKRIYSLANHMTVTVFKFCKIRHKNVKSDVLKEDERYPLMIDPDTEILRVLDDKEMAAMSHWNKQCVRLRQRDKKREPGSVTQIDWVKR